MGVALLYRLERRGRIDAGVGAGVLGAGAVQRARVDRAGGAALGVRSRDRTPY